MNTNMSSNVAEVYFHIIISDIFVSLYDNACVYTEVHTRCVSVKPLQCGDRLYTSESDVCRRQILTCKVDPRTVRVNIIYNGRRPMTYVFK